MGRLNTSTHSGPAPHHYFSRLVIEEASVMPYTLSFSYSFNFFPISLFYLVFVCSPPYDHSLPNFPKAKTDKQKPTKQQKILLGVVIKYKGLWKMKHFLKQ